MSKFSKCKRKIQDYHGQQCSVSHNAYVIMVKNKGDSVKRWKMPCMVQQYLRDKNTTFNAWMHTHVYNFFVS